MAYLHGAYGEIGESKVASVTQADVVAAYIGTAPVNLIRGYADKDLVNMPVKVTNMSEVQSLVGYSDDWETFTLGSAFAEHFDNTVGNVGPIYIVNVLDPAVHKSAQKTTKALTFTDGKAEFESDKIILDTFAIADKAEGVDYALSYSMAKHTVTVTLLKETDGAELSATFDTVDTSKVQAADIIGEKTETGEYTGLASMALSVPQRRAQYSGSSGLESYPGRIQGHGEHYPETQRPLGRLRSRRRSSGGQRNQDRHARKGSEMGH